MANGQISNSRVKNFMVSLKVIRNSVYIRVYSCDSASSVAGNGFVWRGSKLQITLKISWYIFAMYFSFDPLLWKIGMADVIRVYIIRPKRSAITYVMSFIRTALAKFLQDQWRRYRYMIAHYEWLFKKES